MDRRDIPAMAAPHDCAELERKILDLTQQLAQAQKMSTVGAPGAFNQWP
jgi:hypothetical protein